MDQLGLTFEPAPASVRAPEPRKRPASIDERFAAWVALNGRAIQSIRMAALGEAHAGATRLSIAKLAEELRADPRIETVGDSFKINNSFRAPLARMLMDQEPTLRGLFEVRVRKS